MIFSDRVLVLDPFTDDTETAGECRVCLPIGTPGSGNLAWGAPEAVKGHAVRRLYRSPSAEAYGDGSYTITRKDYLLAMQPNPPMGRMTAVLEILNRTEAILSQAIRDSNTLLREMETPRCSLTTQPPTSEPTKRPTGSFAGTRHGFSPTGWKTSPYAPASVPGLTSTTPGHATTTT